MGTQIYKKKIIGMQLYLIGHVSNKSYINSAIHPLVYNFIFLMLLYIMHFMLYVLVNTS
jgi:hypothetical protein